MDMAEPVSNRWNALAKVQIPVPEIDRRGAYQLDFKITAANGEPVADAQAIAGEVDTYDRLASRRVLMGEFTSMACGYCPRGIVGIEYLKEKYPDTFIAVAYHLSDALKCVTHLPYNVDSQPNCLLDRSWLVDPYMGSSKDKSLGIEDDFLHALGQFTYADLGLTAANTDASHTAVRAQATANFIKDCPDQRFRVDFFLVADSLTGDPADYYQQNYYGGEESWSSYEGLQPYVEAKRYMAPFTFNDVLLYWSDEDPQRDPFVPEFSANLSSLVNDYRVDRACRLLSDPAQSSRLTLEAVGEAVGYGSRQTFLKAFKARTGLTPSDFRKAAYRQAV